jgi:hypothetical protein
VKQTMARLQSAACHGLRAEARKTPCLETRMPGLKPNARQTINAIINQLRDQYGPSSVIKELLQNADDAGALRMAIIGMPGISGTRNPLLQSPGLLVANDGLLSGQQFDAMAEASGSDKARDVGKAGRFGLGQKAVFNLCDAFVVQGWVEDQPRRRAHQIINPFVALNSDGATAAQSWEVYDEADAEALAHACGKAGFEGRGVVLYVPLRSSRLRPSPGNGFTTDEPDLRTTIEAYRDLTTLTLLAGSLRNLREISIGLVDGPTERLEVPEHCSRLRGPGDAAVVARPFDGHVLVDSLDAPVRFSGREVQLDHDVVRRFTDDGRWPTTVDHDHRHVPEKAVPHGAAIVMRGPRRSDAALHIHQGTFLPVGAALETGISLGDPEIGRIDLFLHGYYFLDSGRRSIAFDAVAGDADQTLRNSWNAMVRTDVTLPLILPLLLSAFDDLRLDLAQRRRLAKAVRSSEWWRTFRGGVCGAAALAECIGGRGELRWSMVRAAGVRTLAPVERVAPDRLLRLFPDLIDWAASRDLILTPDRSTLLTGQDAGWQDEELVGVLKGLDPRALHRTDATENLAELLGFVLTEGHVRARSQLLHVLRQAIIAEGALANPASLAKVMGFTPAGLLFALPNSVENRQILRALAEAQDDVLAIRSAFAPGAAPTALSAATTIAWLGALEPLLTGIDDLAEQANAAAAAIIGAGPSLSELVANERARHLRVIRARRVGDSDFALLSLAELSDLADRGLLFTAQPGGLLPALAAAISDLDLYTVRLPEGSHAANRLRLQVPGSIAAAASILSRVQRFEGVDARGRLLTQLLRHEGFETSLLRALCIGEPASDLARLELLALPHMAGPLERMAIEAVQGAVTKRLVPPVIGDRLSMSDRRLLEIAALDLETVAELIAHSHRRGEIVRRSDDDAKEILHSGLDHAILAKLPLFRTRDDRLVSIGEPLFRVHEFPVSPSLADKIALLHPWPDRELVPVQNIVPPWSPLEQIRAALRQPILKDYTTSILDAVADASDDELKQVQQQLRDARWIPNGMGGVISGSDVLCLDSEVDAELRSLIPDAVFIPFDRLPAAVRDHDAADRLRSAILPDASDTQSALELLLADCGLVGVVIDPRVHVRDFSMMALARCDLRLPAWALLSAVLRAASDPENALRLASDLFGQPSSDGLILHLNALAEVSGTGVAGAARRLHEAVFIARSGLLISEDGTLPPELLLPSQAGAMRRADQIAARGQGLDSEHVLDDRYASCLPAPSETGSATEAMDSGSGHADLPIDAARGRFAAAVAEYFEPWRGLVPADAIVFLLGLLGRDDAMCTVAGAWEAETRQNDHRPIWCALDAALVSQTGEDDLESVLRDTVFHASVVTREVRVRSAAGTPYSVPLGQHSRSLLVGDPLGTRRRVTYADGTGVHVVDIALVRYSTPNRAAAKDLFDRFIDGVCPALLLTMPSQREVVRQAFEASFQIEQVTIEDAIAKLRDQAPSLMRALVLPDDGVVRAALHAFEAVPASAPAALMLGKDVLWERLKQPEAAEELLSAVRAKIGQMGYDETRVLFELLQNADDAYVQMAMPNGRLRIEVRREGEALTRVALIHWGRPINHPGRGMSETRRRGFRNDLYNMLAINHSEKPADANTTGKFGLGFKTVHMITSAARLASGFISTEIVGGFLPREWDAGIEAARSHTNGPYAATLIELPIDDDGRERAEAALAAFMNCVEWLPAAARRVQDITIVDQGGDRTFGSLTGPLSVASATAGLAIVRNHGERRRRALRIDLGDGFAMLIGIGLSGPERIVTSSAIWNLVPLEEQMQSGWIINGPFEVDPGRSHIKGSISDQAQLFRGFGSVLGERLITLFDAVEQDPDAFAEEFGIDPTLMPSFWGRLAAFFEIDARFDRERNLHVGEAGLGRLWGAREAVATGLAAPCALPVRADTVRHRTVRALSDPATFDRVSAWPALTGLAGAVVSADVGDRLAALQVAMPIPLSLASLLGRELGADRRVDPAKAGRIGAVLNLTTVEQQDLAIERHELLNEAANATFLSGASTWASPRLLVVPGDGDETERSRAAFAPDENLLSPIYADEALAFFRLARVRSGHVLTSAILRGWAERAVDLPRRQAFLRYLLQDHGLARGVGSNPIFWLPSPLGLLREDPLCSGWTDDEVTLLLAMMSQLPPYQPPPLAPPLPPPVDPASFLGAIHDWWMAERVTEIPRYRDSLYPQDFDFDLLRTNDPTAWFTMFALAVFHTLGRTQEEQAQGFIRRAEADGWWAQLAHLAASADQQAWIDRLDEWSDPLAGDQFFVSWRRCLVDLYAIARFLPEFIRIVLSLPAIIHAEGDVSLRGLARPSQSAIVAAMGINAATIDKSLGMGVNWLIRELVRNGIYAAADRPLLHRYCWGASRRVRRLLRCADVRIGPPGDMDLSGAEFDEIVAAMGMPDALFGGDYDLPLQLIARRDYRQELVASLAAAGIDPAVLGPLDEYE